MLERAFKCRSNEFAEELKRIKKYINCMKGIVIRITRGFNSDLSILGDVFSFLERSTAEFELGYISDSQDS